MMSLIKASKSSQLCAGTALKVVMGKNGLCCSNTDLISPIFYRIPDENLVSSIPLIRSEIHKKHHPIGILMNTIEETTKDIKTLRDSLESELRSLSDKANAATDALVKSNAKLRDSLTKTSDVTIKLSGLFGAKSIAETASVLASLVDSLERLDGLNKNGKLAALLSAARND